MAEVLPPMTVEHLLEDLDNPHFTGYVYIGKDDAGWAVAIGAQDFIPALRVYRADPKVADEVRAEFGAAKKDVGLVFGWKRKVFRKLAQADCEDALTVMNAIWDSQVK